MFIADDDGDFSYIPTAAANAPQAALPAGAYRVGMNQGSLYFRPVATTGDALISISSSVSVKVHREIQEFFNPEITARLAAAGLKHRRGIILYGEPGTGKTSLVRALFPYLIAQNAVIVVEPNGDHLERTIIPAIRMSDPDRPVVIVWDEFDKNASYSRSEIIQLLDGLTSPDHLLTIGTTNYLDRISTQMRCRPSRFGLVLEIPPLDSQSRRNYVASKYPMLAEDDRHNVVEITSGKPLDYLEEACKLALMGYDPDEIRDRMQNVAALISTDED